MPDMNKEVSYQCHKYAKPKPIEYIPGEIICQKAYSEEGDKLFIYRKRKPFMCESPIRLHNFGKSFKEIRISPEEPDKSDNLLHIVENKNNRQQQ